MKLLPITEVIVETAEFDTQRLKALEEGRPIPVGTDYQLGEQYDFYNVRQYVFHRDGYKCRVCGAKHGQKVNGVETKFHVHHLETRKTGGNAPGNLITLCTSCHKKYHDGAQPLPDTIRKPRPMRDAAFMGIMRKTLMARLNTLYPNVPISETHGYITKYTRETNRLPKSHINDALCIAGKPTVKRIDDSFLCVPKRTHNRSLHMDTINRGGYRRARQAPKYVHGFRLFDRVKLPDGREGFVFNRESDGRLRVHTLLNAEPTERIKHYKLKRLMNDGALLIEKRSTRI
jgi:N6-L-threonylcarbamoyladenine synthase